MACGCRGSVAGLGAMGDASGGALTPAGFLTDWFSDTVQRAQGRAEGLGVGLVVGGLAGVAATFAGLYFLGGRRR